MNMLGWLKFSNNQKWQFGIALFISMLAVHHHFFRLHHMGIERKWK